jgi:hypothetical protein
METAAAKLQAGDSAPELDFLTRSGEKELLSRVWQDRPALVLWLRHLG